MQQFGDEFIVESFKIPWLIWIQLLVMILLVVLLYFGVGVSTLFDSNDSSGSSPTSLSTVRAIAAPTHHNNPSSPRIKFRVDGSGNRRDVGTSEGIISEDRHGEESAMKESSPFSIFGRPNHPCNYFRLAKQALFKCFGFDYDSKDPNYRQHDKQD